MSNGDQQRKFDKGSRGDASIYTLNLVDKSLLRDDMMVTHCEDRSGNISGAHESGAPIAQEISDVDAAARQEEQHRCATIEYDPRSDSVHDSTVVPTNPLTVDEWASFESGGPASSNPGVPGVILPTLEERADDTLEYNSDVEDNQLDILAA